MRTTPSSTKPIRAHRRAVWLKIIFPIVLPFVLVLGVCIALAVGAATGALERSQIGIVMGVVATTFIAVPMVLLCLIPYVILAVLAWLGGKGYAQVKTPVRFVRRLTAQIAEKTDHFAPIIAKPTVSLNIWVTRLEHMIRGWQQTPPLPNAKDTNDD